MQKYVYTLLPGSEYSGLITLLDYEVSLQHLFSGLRLGAAEGSSVLPDLGLIVGLNEYRFAAYTVNGDGSIDAGSGRCVKPSAEVTPQADTILRAHPRAVDASVLTNAAQARLLGRELQTA